MKDREKALLRQTGAAQTHRLCSVCDRILIRSDFPDPSAQLPRCVDCQSGVYVRPT